MKQAIHPKTRTVMYRCASCGHSFLSPSTKADGPEREFEGQKYHSVTLEICSNCHPFFSGKQMFVDTAGRVEKFMKKYGSKAAEK